MDTELLLVLVPISKLILAVFAIKTIQHMIRDNAQVDGEPELTRGVAELGERFRLVGGRAKADPRRRLVAQTLKLRGDLHGWPVIWTFTVRGTRNGNLSLEATTLTLRLPHALAGGVRATSRATSDAAHPDGWATGDPAFDARFEIAADAPGPALSALTSPVRAALLALAHIPDAGVTLERDTLTVHRTLRAVIDVDTMRATFAALPDLFDTASALRDALHDVVQQREAARLDAQQRDPAPSTTALISQPAASAQAARSPAPRARP